MYHLDLSRNVQHRMAKLRAYKHAADWREAFKLRFVTGCAPSYGGWFNNGMRYVENADENLRGQGTAAEISRRDGYGRIENGWYTDSEFQDETLSGVVFLLPHGRFLAGYERQDRKGRAVDTGAVVDFSETYETALDAARAADSLAESAAESEREWNETWRAGSEWAHLAEDIAAERRDALALIREIKTHGKGALCDAPHIAAKLRAALESSLDQIREWRAKREELADTYGRYNADAFRDGADLPAKS